MGIIAAVAVKKVDDGEAGGAGLMVGICCGWLDDDAFNIFVHSGTVDKDGVDAGGEGLGAEEKEREKEFHAEVFETNIRDEEYCDQCLIKRPRNTRGLSHVAILC